MNTYQSLKNVCTIWMLASVVVGGFVILMGAAAVLRNDLIGLLYIGIAVLLILVAYTFSLAASLFIDIAQGIQQLNERRSKTTPPQLRS